MTNTEHFISLLGSEARILRQDEDTMTLTISGEKNALFTIFHAFPGIDFISYEADLPSCPAIPADSDTIELWHCLEGQVERAADEGYLLLAPGDFAITGGSRKDETLSFPLGFCRGILITLDPACSRTSFSGILGDTDADPLVLKDRYLKDSSFYLIRRSSSIEHIFSELYEAPESIRKSYLRVKVLELILFLCGTEPSGDTLSRPLIPPAQVHLAREISAYLGAHMDRHTTTEELSEVFHVSPTQIKTCIKNVYGMSVYAFARSRKMHAASRLLRHSDATVLEIAGRFGYDNGSKFAKAFRDVIGMTPAEYRNAGSIH